MSAPTRTFGENLVYNTIEQYTNINQQTYAYYYIGEYLCEFINRTVLTAKAMDVHLVITRNGPEGEPEGLGKYHIFAIANADSSYDSVKVKIIRKSLEGGRGETKTTTAREIVNLFEED